MSRAAARAARRAPRPAPLPPAAPRRVSALSRPRRPLEVAPHRDSSYGVLLLHGLADPRRHVYGGTVPWPVVRDRRAAAKAARAARRAGRR